MEFPYAKDCQGGYKADPFQLSFLIQRRPNTNWFTSLFFISSMMLLLISGSAFAESGRSDYDLDKDGLIEINDLDDLNEIRNNLDGTSLYGSSEGCPSTGGCIGFELAKDLDFDTHPDGEMTVSDQFWNEGEGWLPISKSQYPFSAVFHGNDFTIANLYIDRPERSYTGLFGIIENATLSNIGLTGSLMKVVGESITGGLVGKVKQSIIENSYSTGDVYGQYDVGGLVGYLDEGSTIYSSYATGDVKGTSFNVGGLLGYAGNAHVFGSYATGSADTYKYAVGGLIGKIYGGSVTASFASGHVSGDTYVGGLIGAGGGSVVVEANYATGYLSSNTDVVRTQGGLLGKNASVVNSVNNHWATDTTHELFNYGGLALGAATAAQLSCPLHDSQGLCGTEEVLFVDWSSHLNRNNEPYWDFGDSDELPGLLINGQIHRDSDGDGSIDSVDHWRKTWGASDDADNDGHPDRWHVACDETCRNESGLSIDQLPDYSEAHADSDLDGFPESWASSCDASCQANSSLILDVYPNDSDNDGLNNVQDTRDNNRYQEGAVDIDSDSNGLIDIYTLSQLNAIRFQLDGSTYRGYDDAQANNSGCPQVLYQGEFSQRCHGYELKNDLNFDTNRDGQINEQDTYWHEGLGWLPIGEEHNSENHSFHSIFNGHGYQIFNLHINRPESYNVGLFGSVLHGDIQNLGLTGPLMSIIGKGSVGSIAGRVRLSSLRESYSNASVEGSYYYVGGLIGRMKSAEIEASFFTGSVNSNGTGTGGLTGLLYDSHITTSFSTGDISGSYGVGGIVGQGSGLFSIKGSFATGSVFASKRDSGGLLGSPNDWYGHSSVRMEANYWASDTSAQGTSGLSDDSAGVSLADLKCPTRESNVSCVSDLTLYENWSNYQNADEDAYWDFGDDEQLPALVINGIVYRDADNDSVFDSEDDFPSDPAASIDEDQDGYPDEWNESCSQACQNNSPLILDNDIDNDGIEDDADDFPLDPAASLDADNDGLPDEWNDHCSAQCLADSSLVLDHSLGDVDNDGILDSQDPDNTADNGVPTLVSVPADRYISVNSDAGTFLSLELSEDFFLDFVASDLVDGQNLSFSGQINGQALVIDEEQRTTFETGRIEIDWTAVDTSGNRSLPMTQIINVFPLVRFKQSSSITGEPSTSVIEIELTGASPVYPVSVTLQAGLNSEDSAVLNAQDFDVNQTDIWKDLSQPIELLIERGDTAQANTQAALSLPILQDQLEGANETLVFEIAQVDVELPDTVQLENVIMPGFSLHTLIVTEDNLAPLVTVEIVQDGEVTELIDIEKGTVTVNVTVEDPNGDDTHTYVWDLEALGLGAEFDKNVDLDPSNWPLGEFVVSLTVTDEQANPLSALTEVVIKTQSGSQSNPEQEVSAESSGGSMGLGFILLLLSTLFINGIKRIKRHMELTQKALLFVSIMSLSACGGSGGEESKDDVKPDEGVVNTDVDGDGVVDENDLYPLDSSRYLVDSISLVELAGSDQNIGLNGFVINGVGSSDRSGQVVSHAGDINGDGFDDVIIGAHQASPNGTSWAGQSYLVFGSDQAWDTRLDLSSLDGSNGFVINGVDEQDQSGIAVSAAGDINGDNIDDVIIGAFASRVNGQYYTGESYVVFGKNTSVAGNFSASIELNALDGSNGFVIYGSAGLDDSGYDVAAAGDVNNDGVDDVIIGTPGYPDTKVGKSCVVFGKNTLVKGNFPASISLSDLDGSNGFVINGIELGDKSGGSVSGAGDINGDNIDDVIIGAVDRYSDAGESYVVFGKTGNFDATIELSALNGGNGFAIKGVAEGDNSGYQVSGAGDINHDGIDDVIIGTFNTIADVSSGLYANDSYVVFGKNTLLEGEFSKSIELQALNGSNGFVIKGLETDYYSHGSVSAAGDINDDGVDDVIIGSDATGYSLETGESYIVFGKNTATKGAFAASLPLSTLDGSNGLTISGVAMHDRNGVSVSAAGDLNGDGLDDVIIGADLATSNGNVGAGASYVVFGFSQTVAAP